jgi:Rhamnan synthesis protein F
VSRPTHYGRRGPLDRRAPRVLDVAVPPRHESGPRRDPHWAPSRVAVLAHYAPSAAPGRSIATMLTELAGCGLDTVLVSAAPERLGPLVRAAAGPEPAAFALPADTTVLRRPNVGHDFGTWTATLAAFPRLGRADEVVLLNDSMLGPFAPMAPVRQQLAAGPDPVRGLVGSRQHRAHLQTFLVVYRDGVLAEPPLRAFWADRRVERSKARLVRFGELALAETLDAAGIGWSAAFGPGPRGSANPTLGDWAELLGPGFPLVPRSLLDPATGPGPDRLAAVLRERFGAELDDWVDPAQSALAQAWAASSPARSVLPRHALVPPALATALAIEGPTGLARQAGRRLATRPRRRRPRRTSG